MKLADIYQMKQNWRLAKKHIALYLQKAVNIAPSMDAELNARLGMLDAKIKP
jgi:hypothetical protein